MTLILLVENVLQLIQYRIADFVSAIVIDSVAIQYRRVVIYNRHNLLECLACDVEKVCYSAGTQGRDADAVGFGVGIDDIGA